MPPAWNAADPIATWLAVGRENLWIRRAADPLFTRCSFVVCADASELKARLAHGNWSMGQAFFLGNLCFIQQVGGGDEWLVIKETVAFESASCGHMIAIGTFDPFLARIQTASVERCKALDY
jgi:hypothetical protein